MCGSQAVSSEKDTRMAVPEVNLMWEQIFRKNNWIEEQTPCSEEDVTFEDNG